MTQHTVLAAAVLAACTTFAQAQQKEIKVGVIYDYTGAFAAGGSEAAGLGTKIAIDMLNERGGVEGYRIVPIYADAQSKTEVAINEATRLLDQEKVNLIMGVFSSAHCVPMSQKVDSAKKFMWANVCISSAVFRDKKLSYVFRAQVHGDQYGETSCAFIAESAKEKLGKSAKDVKVAIIYEDGPYGAGVASSNDLECKKRGIQVALKEGYAASAPDLSSLVTKLKRARADILLHTGYNPDITLLLRQAREQGLKFKGIIGHGAGYGQIGKLMETFGTDVNYIFNADPVPAQLLDPKTLKPGLGELTKELVKRYQAQKGPNDVPPHASMGFNQSWIFFTDVLPRAIKKHGGIDPEALRKAAIETDIPVGGTVQGYGVKFFPPGSPMAGQNERSSMVMMQYVNGRTYIAWPNAIRTTDPIFPFPKGHPYAQ